MADVSPAGLSDVHEILAFSPRGQGIDKGRIDLALLYPQSRDRESFEARWPAFLSSDPSLKDVVWRQGADQLCFLTESLVPSARDKRPPVLLVVGNPAPHSVLSGMPFSYEGAHREHRFWVVLRETGFLAFEWGSRKFETWEERNGARKEALYSLRYESPFRLGIAMYFSMPSPAATPVWAGMAGLHRLFGARAMSRIAAAEQERLRQVSKEFHQGAGAVIAFQRDAYEGLRLSPSMAYSLPTVLLSLLEAKSKLGAEIPLLGSPPTRLMHSSSARAALSRIKNRILGELI